jgi:predicted secreted hydrolase
MDHEISSSQLSSEQEGWDWAAIQLRDGREIMVYRLRLKKGGIDPHSTLSWVDVQSRVETVKPEGFVWKPLGTWTSPVTKAKYPIRVEIETKDPLTGKPMKLRLEPLADAQEQTGSVGGTAYWEGACRVLDEQGKEIGSAFLELAGYSGDLSQRFN